MSEKVLVTPLRHRGKPTRMDLRLARHLVARGSFAYVEAPNAVPPPAPPAAPQGKQQDAPAPADAPPEGDAPEKPKRSTRRKAAGDAKEGSAKKSRRAYQRRDLKAEE